MSIGLVMRWGVLGMARGCNGNRGRGKLCGLDSTGLGRYGL